MQWKSANSTTGQKEYVLLHNNKKAMTLTFHSETNAARVQASGEKRVFQIRKEGFIRNRTVIRNEYGILLGQLRSEGRENFIEINNEKFFYTIQNNPYPEVIIYKEPDKKSVAVCSLNLETAHFSKNKALPAGLESGLLLSLCWYLATPVKKERSVSVAV